MTDPTTLRTALEALYVAYDGLRAIAAFAPTRGIDSVVAEARRLADAIEPALATPAPAADEAHAHEWHYYDGNETEGTEYRCRCGAMTDDQPAPTPAPPTPPATEPVAALVDELERRVAAVLTKFAGDEIMDLADRYAAARAEVDVEALALALHDAHIECRFWYVDGARTESEFHHDHATRIIAALARRAGGGTVTDLDPRWAFCLTSCGCDGRSLAIECSGDFPASHGGRCKRCTR